MHRGKLLNIFDKKQPTTPDNRKPAELRERVPDRMEIGEWIFAAVTDLKRARNGCLQLEASTAELDELIQKCETEAQKFLPQQAQPEREAPGG